MSRMHAFLLLVSAVNADFTSFHLHNHLNHSISPCTDFYNHVCSHAMYPNETAIDKSEEFFARLAEAVDSRSRNNPIMNDIYIARESRKCTFDSESYKLNLQKRCRSEYSCFLDEFSYFYSIYEKSYNVNDALLFFKKRLNKTKQNIPNLVLATSKILALLVNDYNEEDTFDKTFSFYMELRDRLSIISVLEQHEITGIMIERVRSTEKLLKRAIADRFMKTSWLNESTYFGMDRLSQFLTTLEEMKVMVDFDDVDGNLTIWRSIDRAITKKYFDNNERSTGCFSFDVIHPFLTWKHEIENMSIESLWDVQFKNGITSGLVYNAYFYPRFNSILLPAPIFFPLMWENSSDTTLLGFASIFAHEIFHSFIKKDIANYNFLSERDCIIDHFEKSCTVWDTDVCSSGVHTILEDAPDLEGLRVAYDLLRDKYSDKELQEFEYKELGITRAQALFYAHGIRRCTKVLEKKAADEHSVENIRLNGVVSLMPEFSAAFGCKRRDLEYSTEASSCYLFGPKSGKDRHKREEESNTIKDAIDDSSELNGSGEEP